MNRIKTAATALAALVISMGTANAACSLATVSNKTWVMSATDVAPANKFLLYCGFKTSAAGTIALTPGGCAANRGTDVNFQTPMRYDLVSGSLTQVFGKLCAFDMTLNFEGGGTVTSRLVLESGKSTGTGSWLSNFASYGTLTIARQ